MRRQASLIFILITVLIDVMGLGLIIPVLPKLIEELAGSADKGAQYLGWFGGVYALAQFIFAPIFGALSDRYGRRPVLLVANFGTALDYLIFAMSPFLWIMFITRVISGIFGASFTTANAYIADISKPEERARNFGMIGAVFGLGFIVGPIVGALLGQHNLRTPLYFAAALAFINGLYGLFVLPESLPKEKRSTHPIPKNPLLSLKVLTEIPLVGSLAVGNFFFNMAFQFLQTIWILYTSHRFDWSLLQTALSLTLVGLGSVLVQGGLAGRVIPKLGERRTVLFSQLIGAITFALYGLSTQGWMMYAAIIFGSLGNLGQAASQSIVTKSTPSDKQGSVQGALSALASLTGIVGPPLAGLVYGVFAGADGKAVWAGMPFFAGAVLNVLGWLITSRTFRKYKEEDPARGEPDPQA